MVITGIRHKIKSDIDTRRSALFTKHLMHYLRMFAFLGCIAPVLIVIDYILEPQIETEILSNKYYQVVDNSNNAEYHFHTKSHHFIAKEKFYEHIEIGESLNFYYTPLFKTLTDISYQKDSNIYVNKPFSIYGWVLIAPALTLICSTILLIRTQRQKVLKYEPIINLGIINAFFCIFTLFFVLTHVSY